MPEAPAADRERAAAVLRESAWLRGHGEGLADELLTQGRLVRLAPGQWAQAEGAEETGVLVVVSGTVQMLCQAPGDREIVFGYAGAGVSIGQSLRFGGGPRLTTVVCAEEALVLQVSDRAL